MTKSEVKTPVWAVEPAILLVRLGSRVEGLTAGEAADRLARFGPNVTVEASRSGLFAKLARKLTEPLVAILLMAAAVSGASGDWQSFLIIAVIVLVSVLLDVAQERKAEGAVEALNRSVALTATVRRDGRTLVVPICDLVPGDVIELRAGDLVPADGAVLDSDRVMLNEAALTGEPFPVEKHSFTADTEQDEAAGLFAGSCLTSGNATMIVVTTGQATRFGAIASTLQEAVEPTAFERGIHQLGMLILRLTGFLVLFVLLTQLVRHGLSLESFLFAVALAVGLTPELLPMVMTVTLSRGAIRMARNKVVSKRLSAIHDLGAIDVLCTDKTGTLTEARISLVGSLGPDERESARAIELARINSRFSAGTRSNLDDALTIGDLPSSPWRLVASLPFDFERRCSTVLVSSGGERMLVTKGAPEHILATCATFERADGSRVPLGDPDRMRILGLVASKGRQGLRLLGVACRAAAAGRETVEASDEVELTFVGCVMFVDPPKASASDAIKKLAAMGVRIKIISGDAAPVVLHLVEALDVRCRGMLTGDEVARLTDAALARKVTGTDLFARIAPDQKSRIVRALRQAGHTVGFLGDGINDAPALHAADIGISVEGGTDVAREAADMILLAPDLGVLARGVDEGRRTYANIMKYIRMGTSSNFGNMLSMALASLFLPFLPLAPLQILLNNLIYDVSEFGIPFDNADPEDLAKPRHWNIRSILRFTLIMGPLSSIFDLATFLLLRLGFDAGVESFRTAWFVESIITQTLVIFIIRTSRPIWSSRPHPVLVASSLLGLSAALTLALGPLGHLVGFVPLEPKLLLLIGAISLGYLSLAEVLKRCAMQPPRVGRLALPSALAAAGKRMRRG